MPKSTLSSLVYYASCVPQAVATARFTSLCRRGFPTRATDCGGGTVEAFVPPGFPHMSCWVFIDHALGIMLCLPGTMR